MPGGYHLYSRIEALGLSDLFPVWITGKGTNICGKRLNSQTGPHRVVRKMCRNGAGIYYGDRARTNEAVKSLAIDALTEAVTHENFLCFIHFHDPDSTGHATKDINRYTEKTWEVDGMVADLMALLPDGTDIIACSDHGFGFKSLGDIANDHKYEPNGFVSANMPFVKNRAVQMEIGRLTYALAGGNPDRVIDIKGSLYKLFGESLI
jgi:hypothetical protein